MNWNSCVNCQTKKYDVAAAKRKAIELLEDEQAKRKFVSYREEKYRETGDYTFYEIEFYRMLYRC